MSFFNNARLQLLQHDGTYVNAESALRSAEYVFVYFILSDDPSCKVFEPALFTFLRTHASRLRIALVWFPLDDDEEPFRKKFLSSYAQDGRREPYDTIVNFAPAEAVEIEKMSKDVEMMEMGNTNTRKLDGSYAIPFREVKTMKSVWQSSYNITEIPYVLVFSNAGFREEEAAVEPCEEREEEEEEENNEPRETKLGGGRAQICQENAAKYIYSLDPDAMHFPWSIPVEGDGGRRGAERVPTTSMFTVNLSRNVRYYVNAASSWLFGSNSS